MRKRAIWIVICLVMCLAMGAIGGTAMAEEPKNVKTAGETIYVRSRITQEQAEKEYLNGLFGLPVTPAEELPRLRGTAGGSRFAEGSQEQKLYNALKDRVTAAAAGTLAYTVFEFTTDQIDAMVFNGDNGALAEGESVFDANGDVSEAMENAIGTNLVQLVSDVISAVTFDCPYECYWLDAGDGGFGLVWNYSDFIDTPGEKSVTVDTIYVLMKVAENYRATASDEYTINTELINSAQTAAANARAIVNQNAGKSDYAKLMTYKRKICELTDYNEDAAEGKHLHDYGNPWQLVWVFDGNPETKVVCEGYSKAFQYLCEQSRWSGDVEVIKDIAISTKEHYRVLLNGRILPALGNLYVQDISPRDIQMFYLSLKKQKALTKRSKTGSLSGTTQLHYHRCLHALLEYARQEGIITINPASAVKPPKKDTPKARFYNPEDCAKLLDVLDQLPLIWRLYYYLAL